MSWMWSPVTTWKVGGTSKPSVEHSSPVWSDVHWQSGWYFTRFGLLVTATKNHHKKIQSGCLSVIVNNGATCVFTW